MPLGSIVSLIRSQHPNLELGFLSNLYNSVEKLDPGFVQNESFRENLLSPQNLAISQCKSLIIDGGGHTSYLVGSLNSNCTCDRRQLFAYPAGAPCFCGSSIWRGMTSYKAQSVDGMFVKVSSAISKACQSTLFLLLSMAGDTIRLKALVYKEKNKVLFVESESDFVDILFSFLTVPIGEMVRLTRGISSLKLQIGCMSNFYRSVENLNLKLFRGNMCQTMLLKPKNAAAFLCTTLKWRIGDDDCLSYYRCPGENCNSEGEKLLSYYHGHCICCSRHLTYLPVWAPPGGGFLKLWTRFLVSDELDVMTATSAASFSLVSKVQMREVSLAEKRTFQIGQQEVMKLLYYSLVSKKPLTETFLQQEMTPESRKRDAVLGICIKHEVQDRALEGKPAICTKLFVSKSKRTVCYAEACKEFIDLLFIFLTIPLGYVQKS